MVKSLCFAAAALLAAPVVQAHYIFNIRKCFRRIPEDILTVGCSDGQRPADWWRVRLRSPQLQHVHAILHRDRQLVSHV